MEVEEDTRPTEISSGLTLPKHSKTLLIILGIVITLLGTLTLTLVIYTWDRGEIANGVVISGISLGQHRMEEARQELEKDKKEILTLPVHFTAKEKNVSISPEELGLTLNYDRALQQAYLIDRKGSLFEKGISKFKASWGISINPDYQWNDQLLAETLNKNFASLNIPAQNAKFEFTPEDTIKILPEKAGTQVDIAALSTSIKKLTLKQAKEISIPFQDVKPAITKAELENLKIGILSSYTTQFNPNLKERTQNISLAAKAIDGTLLKPDEIFSFNQTVGPRTAEAGYQTAIIIEGDKFVPGLGGGVCQVSSTLYNAVRLASLSVSERSPHSLSITYVPPGQDATVAYPTLDFKFKNDSGSYLLIRSNVTEDSLTFSLYGKVKD